MGCATSTRQVSETVEVPKSLRDASPSLESASFEDCYDVQGELGSGSFARVYACKKKETQMESAVKILKYRSNLDQRKAWRELQIWRQVGNHENVVALLDSHVESGTYYYIMPRCQCSISELLNLRGDKFDLIDAFHQVFRGLQHCHTMNVVHRDMKPSNMLIDFEGKVKIADFGLSIDLPSDGLTGLVGSVPYMSPEMVKGKPYAFGTDIWSCGVAAYTMLYGRYPYEAVLPYSTTVERRIQIVKAIETNTPAPSFEPLASVPRPARSVRRFIETLLVRDPMQRPDAGMCSKLSSSLKDVKGFEEGEFAKKINYMTMKGAYTDAHGNAESSCATVCPSESTANVSVSGGSSSSPTLSGECVADV